MQTIIKNGNVLIREGNDMKFEKLHIQIDDGFITQLFSSETNNSIPADYFEGSNIVDAENQLVIPGFVNSHYHSHDNIIRGFGLEYPLEIWTLLPSELRQHYSPREAYISTLLGCLELISTGCTGVIDQIKFSFEFELDCILAVIEAYKVSGLRAIIVPVLSDLPLQDTLPLNQKEKEEIRSVNNTKLLPAKEQIDRVRFLLEKVKSEANDRIRIGVGPSGPQRCSDQLLLMSADLADSYNTIMHTHVLESVMQREKSKTYSSGSVVAHMDQLGVLGPHSQCVHMVWASTDDLDLISKTGSQIILNPISNIFLGSGIAPISLMKERDIPLALGTDSICCNGSHNYFETLKWAALINHVETSDPNSWLNAKSAIEMATTGGYRALLMENVGGDVAPGRIADLVFLDQNSYSLFTLNDGLRQVVYSSNPSDVNQVWIAGNCIYNDGIAKSISKDEILSEAKELIQKRRENYARNPSVSVLNSSISQAYKRVTSTVKRIEFE